MHVIPKILDDIFILWKSYDEWEKILCDVAMTKFETLDFIAQDEEKFSWRILDRDLLIMILQDLENKGKCGLLKDNIESFIAAKFFR